MAGDIADKAVDAVAAPREVAEKVAADGVPLGIFREPRYTEAKVELSGGDIVVFYTDGITERTNAAGEFFGTERLNGLIVAHRKHEPEAIIDAVFQELNRFAGAREQEDDVTLVVMKRAA